MGARQSTPSRRAQPPSPDQRLYDISTTPQRLTSPTTPGRSPNSGPTSPSRRYSSQHFCAYRPGASSADPKPVSILRRSRIQPSPERPRQRIDSIETTSGRDTLECFVRRFQPMPSHFHPCRFDVGRRRHTELGAKDPRELPFTDMGVLGQIRHGELTRDISGDVVPQVVDAPRSRDRLERNTELALTARPFQIHHQLPRHPQRDLVAEVIGDERQRQIETRRETRSGPDVSSRM